MFRDIKKKLLRDWDGDESLSQYKESDNLLLDVFENDGRILHEKTDDGYTHEIVQRDGYRSEDYYFPYWGSGSRTHNHYELHSDGALIINGQIIGGFGQQRKSLADINELTGSQKFDRKVYLKKIRKKFEHLSQIKDLGSAFESDKTKLEEQLCLLEQSDLSDDVLKEEILELNHSINLLKKEYLGIIVEAEKQLEAEQKENILQAEAAETAARKIAQSLHNTHMTAAETGTERAELVAVEQAKDFQKTKDETREKLNEVINTMREQYKRILNDKTPK